MNKGNIYTITYVQLSSWALARIASNKFTTPYLLSYIAYAQFWISFS